MRKEFLSHVSHELKTPLTSIMGFSETLLDGVDDKETEQHFLKVIKDKKGKNFKIHPLKYTLMELRKINYLKRNNLPIPAELKNRKFEHFPFDETKLKKKPVVTSKRISQPIQTTVIKTKGKKKIVKKVIIEEEIEESDDDSLPMVKLKLFRLMILMLL